MATPSKLVTRAERSAALLAFKDLPADTPTIVDGGVAVDGRWSWVISVDEIDADLAEAYGDLIQDAFAHGGRRWVIIPY